MAAPTTTSCYALQGNLAAALAWLPCEATSSLRPYFGLVYARAGRLEDVLSLEWLEAQACPEVHEQSRRGFYLFRSFARHQLDPDSPLLAGELEEARPARPDEFDYLGDSWPELRSFIKDHIGSARPRERGAEFAAARILLR